MLLSIPFISCFSMLCMHNIEKLTSVCGTLVHSHMHSTSNVILVVMSGEEQPCGYAGYHQFEIMQHVVIIMQHVVVSDKPVYQD